MKTIPMALAILVLSAGFAMAQQDMTGFSSKHAPAVSPESSKLAPNPHPDLSPKMGGIFVDGGKHGWVLVSPGADSSYGIGEKYLSAPRQYGPDVAHLSSPGGNRDTGGFKLLSFEF
jgi:hypothetical protein